MRFGLRSPKTEKMVHLLSINRKATMAKNYKNVSYFEDRPDIVKIFDDLEKFHDFCRFELAPFNEADLYNRNSQVWNNYYYSTRPKKPWDGTRKPRGEFNRSSGNNNYRQRNDSFSR